MRVIVCGGRDYKEEDVIYNTLSSLQSMYDLKIATGGATGADRIAYEWALENCEARPRTYMANWTAHGKAAGPIRNKEMLFDFDPDIVVAFPGGRGTADMVKKAQDAGVTVLLVGKNFPL